MTARLHNIARAFIVFLLTSGGASVTLAQAPAVTLPPPEISFGNPRFREATETAEVFDLQFPSALASPWHENNVVPIRAFFPTQRLRRAPVVILLHFWGASDGRVEQSFAEELNRRGIGAVLMALPYHLGRTPAGFRSGELAVRPDVRSLVETMTQSVLDVRRTIDWIQTRPEFDPQKIGISGTSLGGIVASLAFNIDPRLQTASFMLAGVDLAKILWNSSRVVSQRETLRRQGYTEDRLRLELAEIEPTRYASPREDRRTYVIAARFDTIIPKQSTESLIAMLQSPEVLWLDTGHVGGFLVERAVWQSAAKFFEAVFEARPFSAPQRFFSPTIRVGIQANGDHGLQIAAGIDLWRSNRAGDGFASALITPRGPQGFIGYRVTRGLSVGVSVTTKKTTWGVFWNLVL